MTMVKNDQQTIVSLNDILVELVLSHKDMSANSQ